MNSQPDTISEIEAKRILAELELQRMGERRVRVRKRAESQEVFALYLSALFLYAGLFYWADKSHDSKVFIVLIAASPILMILLSMFSRLCRDTRFIRNELEKNKHEE